MKGLFRADGQLVEALGKIADIVVLSLCWIVASLPVVTLLSASAALYRTVSLCLWGDNMHAFRTFWISFRTNLRGGFVPGLSVALLTAINVLWYTFSNSFEPTGEGLVYLIVSRTLIFIQAIGSIFLIPLFASRVMRTLEYWKNAYFLAMRYLPRTICGMLLFTASALLTVVFFPLILLVPAVTALFHTRLTDAIMETYMPSANQKGKEREYGI